MLFFDSQCIIMMTSTSTHDVRFPTAHRGWPITAGYKLQLAYITRTTQHARPVTRSYLRLLSSRLGREIVPMMKTICFLVVLLQSVYGKLIFHSTSSEIIRESRAVARKPRHAAAVPFGLKFANNIRYKFKSSQASKARLQSSKYTGAKQILTQNCHSR